MKVWVNYREAGFSGGMILVAANSEEEAHEVFHADERYKWMWDDINWENPPFEEDMYYQPENWKQMPMLDAALESI